MRPILIVLAVTCASSTSWASVPSEEAASAAPIQRRIIIRIPQHTAAEAEAKAKAFVRDTKRIDLSGYQTPNTKESTWNDRPCWLISFIKKPPTPPGGHFLVVLDDETGELSFHAGM